MRPFQNGALFMPSVPAVCLLLFGPFIGRSHEVLKKYRQKCVEYQHFHLQKATVQFISFQARFRNFTELS